MNLRSLTAKVFVCAAVVAAAVPTVAGQAYAGGNGNINGSCGDGFTLATVSVLASDANTWYGGEVDWTAYFMGVDKNGDGSLCWHLIGKTCSCSGNPTLVVVDDNANAT